MIDRDRLRAQLRLLPESALAGLVLAGLGGVIVFFGTRHYLPQPFIFDVNDTFMDWFNTAYYAHNPGAYEVWNSVYPPLSFAFLWLSGIGSCYLYSPFYARSCDWLGIVVIFAFYAIDGVLIAKSFWRTDRRTAPFRTIALVLGLPMLFALERGNLVLVCLTFFVLAYGPLVRSPLWRAVASAMTINFKPYLLLAALPYGIVRRWRTLELAGIATLGIYLASWAFIGAGSVPDLLSSAATWVTFIGGQVWEQIYYSTSFAPLLQIAAHDFPILHYVPSRTVDTIMIAVPAVIRSTQIIALLCLIGAWLQPGALSFQRLAAVMLGTSLATASPGGYTETFLLFLLFLERWERPGPIVAITCGYLLCVPFDIVLAKFFQMSKDSWLSGQTVSAGFGLAVGQFFRPGLVVGIVWALSLDGLAQIVRAHRGSRPTLGLVAGGGMAPAAA